jgi:hypothetical protein
VLLPLTLLLLAYGCWRGSSPLGIALMSLGFAAQLWVTIRLARATAGPVGGHAEWVREGSTRPRLLASPIWMVGLALVLAGFALALSS